MKRMIFPVFVLLLTGPTFGQGQSSIPPGSGAEQTLAYDDATTEQSAVLTVVFCTEGDEVKATVFDRRVGTHQMLGGYQVTGADGERKGRFEKKLPPCAAQSEGSARSFLLSKKAEPHRLPDGGEFWWLHLRFQGGIQSPPIPADRSRIPYRMQIFYRQNEGFSLGEEFLPVM